MKIIITAGGTSERIDDVRMITNFSTGSLGIAIGEAFAKAPEVEKIYYIHGNRALYPADEKIEAIGIMGVQDLLDALERILREEKIDAVIHAAAVSDFMVGKVTTMEELISKGNSEDALSVSGNKISSEIDELVICMKKSPKVISRIKPASPESTLVGFKLLSGVPHDELIDVAYRLLQKNDCSFVLANDLREIGEGLHRGYLVHRDKSYDTMNTNQEIADMIVRRVLEERSGKCI